MASEMVRAIDDGLSIEIGGRVKFVGVTTLLRVHALGVARFWRAMGGAWR